MKRWEWKRIKEEEKKTRLRKTHFTVSDWGGGIDSKMQHSV